MSRNYNMAKRSRQAAEKTMQIITATERLLTNKYLNEINLKAIAEEANTTVQTVLRHMGSRDGCLKAVAKHVSDRVEKQRGNFNYNSVAKAISDLTDHYEAEGKLVLNLLAQEQAGDNFISLQIRKGRSYHRKWVEGCFSNYLSNNDKVIIDSLVAATDIYIWKLLRLDLGRSKNAVKNIITNIVNKILGVS